MFKPVGPSTVGVCVCGGGLPRAGLFVGGGLASSQPPPPGLLMLRPQGAWLPALWPWLWPWPWPVAAVVLEFPWRQFLLWPLVLSRLLTCLS